LTEAPSKSIPALHAAPHLLGQVEIFPAGIVPSPGRDLAELRTELDISPGFYEWLAQHAISLAFSTYDAGHLYLVSASSGGRLTVFQSLLSKAMGLASHNGRLWVAGRQSIERFENILPPGKMENGRFDRVYLPRASYVTGDLLAHEMGVLRNGEVIFVNSRFSCLASLHPTHSFVPLWKPSFIDRMRPDDRCHLNGLAMEDGTPRYVTAFTPSGGWRDRPVDEGVIIDVRSGRIVTQGLIKPHSPRVRDGALWVIDSGRGYLVRVEPGSGARENVAFIPGFARGLSFAGRYAMVTTSLPRDETFAGLAIEERLRERNEEPQCAVFVIDVRKGEIAHWLRLKGRTREMFDVIALPGARCPKIISLSSPLIADIYTFAMRGAAEAA
jgi:uncharacterized protein (TIGR03032 family)